MLEDKNTMGANLSKMTPSDLGAAVAALGKAVFFSEFGIKLEENGIGGDLVDVECTNIETFQAFLDMLVESGFPVPSKIQVRVLFTAATKEKNSDAASTPSGELVISTELTIPPRNLLSRLFQIQGIPLDPRANISHTIEDIFNAVIAYTGGLELDGDFKFHVFISYRVATNALDAERIRDKLMLKGLKVFLDKFELRDGFPWKEGFFQGLKESKSFICLVSSNAFSQCKDSSRSHQFDNFLLELETALRFQSSTEARRGFIIPVHIGAYDESNRLIKFNEFNTAGFAASVIPLTASLSSTSLSTEVSIYKYYNIHFYLVKVILGV